MPTISTLSLPPKIKSPSEKIFRGLKNVFLQQELLEVSKLLDAGKKLSDSEIQSIFSFLRHRTFFLSQRGNENTQFIFSTILDNILKEVSVRVDEVLSEKTLLLLALFSKNTDAGKFGADLNLLFTFLSQPFIPSPINTPKTIACFFRLADRVKDLKLDRDIFEKFLAEKVDMNLITYEEDILALNRIRARLS